jgi:cell division protein FtsB
MRSTVTTIIFMTILAMTLLGSYKLVMAKTDGSREAPFTQDDRDRLIRLETKVDEGQKALNQRIDDLREEVKDLKTFMLWGFGILFGGMGILIGFVIWDRRTALAPAIKKNKELEEREEKIERALKELAKKDPKVAEVLKHVGLL